MAGKTTIEWTDSNWNPIRGCSRVSEGCRNCYAEGMAARFSDEGNWGEGLAEFVTRPGGKREARWTGKLVQAPEATLTAPLRWKAPRMIFVNSTSDLFHEDLPDDVIDRVFAVMALRPQHTFQILTKRPERMRAYFAFGPWLRWLEHMKPLWHGRWVSEVSENGGLPNVWLGVSVEDQATAEARIPHLLETPAAIRFISAEPLLGPVDVRSYLPGSFECATDCGWRGPDGARLEELCSNGHLSDGTHEFCPECGTEMGQPICPECEGRVVQYHPDTPHIAWLICGGESGPGARPLHPDWARALRDQCAAADVPFFFKQHGNWLHESQDADGQFGWSDADERGILHYWPGDPAMMTASMPLSKKAAGRLLDGVTHDAMPGAAVPRVEASQ